MSNVDQNSQCDQIYANTTIATCINMYTNPTNKHNKIFAKTTNTTSKDM